MRSKLAKLGDKQPEITIEYLAEKFKKSLAVNEDSLRKEKERLNIIQEGSNVPDTSHLVDNHEELKTLIKSIYFNNR